ncbi:MAG: hypothetical protein UDB11_11380 [Peptococcaceae bacterium]|nr:hypothetical protein [Peptococcaceae bacterium]
MNRDRYQDTGRVDMLKGRQTRCCCKYCGGELQIRRIIFSEDEEARIELFCSQCDRIEYGVEPEIYKNAVHFVDYLQFDHYPDLDKNMQTRRMNIAKVCEIITWGVKNLGLLDQNGFKVPVVACNEVAEDCMLITADMLQERMTGNDNTSD